MRCRVCFGDGFKKGTLSFGINQNQLTDIWKILEIRLEGFLTSYGMLTNMDHVLMLLSLV